MSAPAHTLLSIQQFLTQNSMTPMPHPPYLPDFALRKFFLLLFPQMKSPQRETFCLCGIDETKKMAEALNEFKIDEFTNCFEQGKNISIDVLHQMESVLKVTEV